MDKTAITKYITETFPGVEAVVADGNTFFFYGAERMMPMVTLVTTDAYDAVSNLSRPGVFRLNIGVSKATFQSLLGAAALDDTHDFTSLDRLMPHPVYGKMHWVCILNPSDANFEKVIKPLLAEAYAAAKKQHD
jgi:hypothetical protein